jgi:hypothetical protein
MHRSGTSTASRLLGLAGAAVPSAARPGRLSNDANARGFWEVRPLTDLNEEVLHALDGEWSAPPPLPQGWLDDPRLDRLRRRGATLARRYLSTPGAVWKDPRLCLTLPFWSGVIPQDAPAMLVVRNPLEIAASLSSRDGFDLAVGVALWERYLHSALDVLARRPVLVVSYERAVADPAAMVAAMRAWLIASGAPVRNAGSPEEIAAFVGAELRHSQFGDDDVERDARLSDEQKALHRALVALAGVHPSFEPPALSPHATGDELLETRRAERATQRAARAPWVQRARRRVLVRASVASRRLRRGS